MRTKNISPSDVEWKNSGQLAKEQQTRCGKNFVKKKSWKNTDEHEISE